MLTRVQKEEIVAELSEDMKNAKAVVLVDYKGLTAGDTRTLKTTLRDAGATFQVVKKTLLALAFKNAGSDFDTKSLKGQVAISLSTADEVAAAKIIKKFSKEKEGVAIIGGILGTTVLSVEEVNALAQLPSLPELRAKVVGTLNAPIAGFVSVLAGNLRALACVLKAVAEKKVA